MIYTQYTVTVLRRANVERMQQLQHVGDMILMLFPTWLLKSHLQNLMY